MRPTRSGSNRSAPKTPDQAPVPGWRCSSLRAPVSAASSCAPVGMRAPPTSESTAARSSPSEQSRSFTSAVSSAAPRRHRTPGVRPNGCSITNCRAEVMATATAPREQHRQRSPEQWEQRHEGIPCAGRALGSPARPTRGRRACVPGGDPGNLHERCGRRSHRPMPPGPGRTPGSERPFRHPPSFKRPSPRGGRPTGSPRRLRAPQRGARGSTCPNASG